MFLLGMLSRRANNFGVIAGAVVGAAATIFVTYFTTIHWLWYFVVGSMGGLFGGYILSFLRPADVKQWSLEKSLSLGPVLETVSQSVEVPLEREK